MPRRKLEPTFPVQFIFKSKIIDPLYCSIDLSDSNAVMIETIPVVDQVLFPLAVRMVSTENRGGKEVMIENREGKEVMIENQEKKR